MPVPSWQFLKPVLVVLALLWTTASSLFYFPHSLSYFNEIAGGPDNGAAHLVDSNLDWGQDLFFLKKWCGEHPEARPFYFFYFGRFDPRDAGLEFSLPCLENPDSVTGCIAVSQTLFTGYSHTVADGVGGLAYFDGRDPGLRRLKARARPIARAGFSILIFTTQE